jgi:hypothetical protein
MKISKVTLVALWFAVPSAFAGPSVSGGGNGIGSSPSQVADGLIEAKEELGVFVHAAASDPSAALNPSNIKSQRVQSVLRAWLAKSGTGEALVADTDDTIYRQQAGECPSQTDHDYDASTLHQRGAPICFSTTRLSRFPNWTLPAELVALAAHEHAHHFGFGEEDARAVQAYIFGAYAILRIQQKLETFYHSEIDNYRYQLKNGFIAAGTALVFAARLCRDEALIEGMATAYGIRPFVMMSTQPPVCDPNDFDPDKTEQTLRSLELMSVHELNSN